MKYYHDFYLKRDILLLADVFKKFKNSSWKNYGLCPSASALSWDAMLNMTKLELELLPDPDMRGGLSYISNRYSKANNNYWKSCDPKQELRHNIYE